MSQKQSILLVEPDDDVRPTLREHLSNWGYEVIVALDEADAFHRVENQKTIIDLILINQVSQSIEKCAELGRQIRQHAKLDGSTLIVVMAEQYGAEQEGQDIQVGENEYVTYLEDGEQLRNLLYQLCPTQQG